MRLRHLLATAAFLLSGCADADIEEYDEQKPVINRTEMPKFGLKVDALVISFRKID